MLDVACANLYFCQSLALFPRLHFSHMSLTRPPPLSPPSLAPSELFIWDCNQKPSQSWQGGGVFQWQSKENATKCINLANNGDATNGNAINIFDCASYSERISYFDSAGGEKTLEESSYKPALWNSTVTVHRNTEDAATAFELPPPYLYRFPAGAFNASSHASHNFSNGLNNSTWSDSTRGRPPSPANSASSASSSMPSSMLIGTPYSMDFGPPTVLPNGLRLGKKWECTNDGTCCPSDDKVRAKWATYDDCFKECGQGKWKCVSAHLHPKRKRCTPDATGTITGAAGCQNSDCAVACEGQCVSSG
jgi:hypothetical protein